MKAALRLAALGTILLLLAQPVVSAVNEETRSNGELRAGLEALVNSVIRSQRGDKTDVATELDRWAATAGGDRSALLLELAPR